MRGALHWLVQPCPLGRGQAGQGKCPVARPGPPSAAMPQVLLTAGPTDRAVLPPALQERRGVAAVLMRVQLPSSEELSGLLDVPGALDKLMDIVDGLTASLQVLQVRQHTLQATASLHLSASLHPTASLHLSAWRPLSLGQAQVCQTSGPAGTAGRPLAGGGTWHRKETRNCTAILGVDRNAC